MNPLLAVVKGVANSADKAAKSARTRMMDQVAPSPSMAYNLGMGIGPMLQAIVTEIKKKDDKKQDAAQKDDSGLKAGLVESKKQTRMLATQLGSMVTLLKDIKNIGLAQMRQEQLKAFESRRQSYASKIADSITGKGTTDVTEKEGIGGTLLGSLVTGITASLPGILKVALIGGGLYALWNNIFDEFTQKTIKDFIFGKDSGDKSLTEVVMERVKESWLKAFEEDALTTIVGTGLAAWATGLLGALGVVGRVAWAGGKLIYNVGAYVGKGMLPTIPPPATPVGPAPSATPPLPPIAPIPMTRDSTIIDPKTGKPFQIPVISQSGGPSSPLPSPSATQPTPASTGGIFARFGSLLSKAGSVLSGLLGAIGVAFSGINAFQEAQQGKTISASLFGTSAALGTAAIGTAATGIGIAATPWLAGASALTGVAATIASYFESPAKPKPSAVEGPSVSATPSPSAFRGGAPINRDEVMKLIQFKFGAAGYSSAQIWAALANAARESGFNPYAHNTNGEDSVGLFQANRRGGLGTGHSIEELQDPAFNTQLILNALRKAEGERGYFGDNARGFRNATSKEEAAEYLRRFLLGNGTQQQQLAGAQKQSKVNRDFEAGAYGAVPSLSIQSSNLASAPPSFMPGPSQVTPSSIRSTDADSGNLLSEVTNLVNDLTKQMMGGGITMVDQSNKSTNVSNNNGGGGSGGPAYVGDTIRSAISGLVYPAEHGFM